MVNQSKADNTNTTYCSCVFWAESVFAHYLHMSVTALFFTGTAKGFGSHTNSVFVLLQFLRFFFHMFLWYTEKKIPIIS